MSMLPGNGPKRDDSGATKHKPIPTCTSPIPAQSPRPVEAPKKQRVQTEFDKG